MRLRWLMAGLKCLGIAIYVLGLPFFIVWLAGDWHWVEGWVFGGWFAGLFGFSMLWLYLKDRSLLAERLRMPGSGGQSGPDLMILLGIKVLSITWIVVSPLDVRFAWLPRIPAWVEIFGAIALAWGGFFLFRSLADNTFSSQVVRIQAERGHHLIDNGVYEIVRHPLYLGGCLVSIGGPLLLGSLAGLLAGVGVVGLIVIRIFGEEDLLVQKLEGYDDYRRRVRHRLLPDVW